MFHRTGDSGYLNGDGKLYLTGRCSTLFLQNGKYVCPFLLENYFQTLPGVEIGTILHKNHETIVVFELNDNSKRKNIEEQTKKLPLSVDRFVFLKKFPRDPRHNSKIDYEKLIALV